MHQTANKSNSEKILLWKKFIILKLNLIKVKNRLIMHGVSKKKIRHLGQVTQVALILENLIWRVQLQLRKINLVATDHLNVRFATMCIATTFLKIIIPKVTPGYFVLLSLVKKKRQKFFRKNKSLWRICIIFKIFL